MFSKAIEQGVNLQTNTPVQSVSSGPDATGRWILKTSRGVVKAKQVVMATNAYTSALLPEYTNKIIPYRAVCSHIVTPGKAPLLTNSYALRFAEWDFDYLIPRPDGSIIVGGARRAYIGHQEDWYGNVDDTKLIERARHYFDGYMQRHFSGWENSGAYVDDIWTGSTPTPFPHSRQQVTDLFQSHGLLVRPSAPRRPNSEPPRHVHHGWLYRPWHAPSLPLRPRSDRYGSRG